MGSPVVLKVFDCTIYFLKLFKIKLPCPNVDPTLLALTALKHKKAYTHVEH